MHATEDDVSAPRIGCLLRKLVGIAAKIGVADHLVALIVMAQDGDVGPQGTLGRSNAVVHGVVGKNEIIIQTANSSCGRHKMSAFSFEAAWIGHCCPTKHD